LPVRFRGEEVRATSPPYPTLLEVFPKTTLYVPNGTSFGLNLWAGLELRGTPGVE
jgi:hypothetical protein